MYAKATDECMPGKPVRVAILIGVHNRREVTRQCLLQLRAQELSDDVVLSTYVVDDGSTDGTREMLGSSFPEVRCVPADGSLFWGGAMRLAEETAKESGPDFFLWLNDDAILERDALASLIDTSLSAPDRPVVCGAFKDPDTGELTYSGAKVSRSIFRFTVDLVAPREGYPRSVDTFNGNAVLIPHEVAALLGGIDPRLTHHYGDFDYGLRASRSGVSVLLAPGFVGSTSRNRRAGTFADHRLPRLSRLRLLFGSKGYPPREKAVYLRRHGSRGWVVQYLAVYVRYVCLILLGRPAEHLVSRRPVLVDEN